MSFNWNDEFLSTLLSEIQIPRERVSITRSISRPLRKVSMLAYLWKHVCREQWVWESAYGSLGNLSRGWENAQEGGLRINQGASTHVVRDPVTKANRLALFAPPSLPFSNKTGWAEWGTQSKEGKGEGVPFDPISSVHFRCTGFVSLSPPCPTSHLARHTAPPRYLPPFVTILPNRPLDQTSSQNLSLKLKSEPVPLLLKTFLFPLGPQGQFSMALRPHLICSWLPSPGWLHLSGLGLGWGRRGIQHGRWIKGDAEILSNQDK